MRKKFLLCTGILIFCLLAASPALAKVGVGINLGRISVNQPLYAGGIYSLAKMTVINTGTESGNYQVDISYLEGQKQLKPAKNWFRFTPDQFNLKAGEARQVDIKLALPINARSGDYFAFVEGRPAAKKKGLSIGIAAAAKLTFAIKSSTLYWAVFNWITAALTSYAPYSYVLLGLISIAIIWLIIRRYFALSFRLERRGKS